MTSNLILGSTTTVRYYLTDAQDSVIATVANTGDTRRYLYEPYGEQIRSWIDTTPGAKSSNAATPPDGSKGAVTAADNAADPNPCRYAAGYRDFETGWLKYGTRFYDPRLARRTQTDPVAPVPGSVSLRTSKFTLVWIPSIMRTRPAASSLAWRKQPSICTVRTTGSEISATLGTTRLTGRFQRPPRTSSKAL